MGPEYADESNDSRAIHCNADVLIGLRMTETRIPRALTFGKNVSVKILVPKIAAIRPAPILGVEGGDTRRVTVSSWPITKP
jgi:hypothetical protein